MLNCPSCGLENPEDATVCEFCGYNLKAKSFTAQAEIELLNRALSPKFKIEKKIGRGGMATVYLGEQLALDRKIVVKLLSEEYSEDNEIRERFLQEARTPARIKHPNLVEVIDVGIHEGRPFYIMEYLPGGSLSDKLSEYKVQNKAFPHRDALYIISKVLIALDYCHNNRLSSHRDIKPDNIMFRATGEPVIVDFGIAKVAGEFRTQTRMTLGTANYMSPEQCRGTKDIDGRSDVYAVGIMLFELLTGDVPFKGESGLSVMGKHVNAKMPDLALQVKDSEYESDIPNERTLRKIEYIIKKACSKKRERRYQTAQLFSEDLEKLLNEKQTRSTTTTGNGSGSNFGLIAAILLLSLGLGSIFTYKFLFKKLDNIQIETEPAGAGVVDSNGKNLGKTPFSYRLNSTGIYRYTLHLDGYVDKSLEFSLEDLDIPIKHIIKLEPASDLITPEHTDPPVDPKDPKENGNNPPENKEDKNQSAELFKLAGLEWQALGIKKMNWSTAVSYCKKKGMRLPSLAEWKAALENRDARLQKPCCEYWTSTLNEEDPEEALNIQVDNYREPFFSYKANLFYTRCVKK
ncbi:MAG: protein kinase [Leptospiraceae bacterium]|nr:protein kinase [Leptospiraceae bacterium]